METQQKRVAILGSGNWGSAIATIVGKNIKESAHFVDEVRMWVFEEEVAGQKLTEIINTKHENVKYLPGVALPPNVVAVPDPAEAVKDAQYLIFVVPHQFIGGLCAKINGHVAEGARGISLIKGMNVTEEGPQLITDLVARLLNINMSVLCGANIANEVAVGEFSEATIGYSDVAIAKEWVPVFNTPNFRISIIEDVAGVEMCGALKNVVAIAAGFCDGLKLSPNAKAAIMRIGLVEMRQFVQEYAPDSKASTFFESCGVADLIVTCYSGRNRKVAAAFAETRRSFVDLEAEMLNGQKLQGTLTAQEVHQVLSKKGLTDKYPLFTRVYEIVFEGKDPKSIISFKQTVQH